ncbi:LANO_0A06964g1_1 [Lachancea nothofagi CBS 11611]|uniref:LANO_0A06964g1_1 n=1 Tax=Lachancea nothofagi CBS 11611 TaxID=1266666 RepID=A0A1G4IRY3_9SACH|nr:LANO_0A06964g1_1 [Lachancea nothofagi CBS 11611]
MAPPTLVCQKHEFKSLWKDVKGPCVLKSLIQYECEFNGYEYDCVPFKRVFEECITGEKLKKFRREVTNERTNQADEMVQKFWSSVKRDEL